MRSNDGTPAEAISLDSAAHESESPTPVPLGVTTGLNSYASVASGCIVTYPPSDATSSDEFKLAIDKEGTKRVSSIFDPSTHTVSDPAHYSGIAGSRIGFTSTVREGTHMAALTIQPGDGSPETNIPFTPGTTYLPTSSYIGGLNTKPHEMFTEEYPIIEEIVVNTPGATVIALDVTATSDNASYLDPKSTKGSTFRLFGVTGR